MGAVTSCDLRMAEFLSLYKRCIAVKKLSDNSAKWFPKWFESYVRFHRFHTKESVEKGSWEPKVPTGQAGGI